MSPFEHPLTKTAAEKLVRSAAQLPLAITYRDHGLERMKARRIDALDIVRMLRSAEMVRGA